LNEITQVKISKYSVGSLVWLADGYVGPMRETHGVISGLNESVCSSCGWKG